MRQALYRIYWKLERLIDPGVVSSQQLYAEALQEVVVPETTWLDLGCGHSLYADWIAGQRELVQRAKLVIGADYEFDSVIKHAAIDNILVGDLNHLPFAPATFDLVSANMVVEHIADPQTALTEIHRILKPGGLFLFHTPNYWDARIIVASLMPQWLKNMLIGIMEGRQAADVFPTFYRMNTEPAIAQAAPVCGFQVRELHLVRTSAAGDIMLGPLVVPILLWRRLTGLHRLRKLRSNLIVSLVKT